MKHVVILILIAAAASAVSFSSKSLKNKLERKRQALTQKVRRGAVSGGPNADPLFSLRPGAKITVFGDQEENQVPWDEATCTGQQHTWVSGLGVWQDDNTENPKGVTGVEIRCARRNQNAIITSYSATSGRLTGTKVALRECPDHDLGDGKYGHRWMVGMRVVYGDHFIGIVQIIPICQAAHERTCANNLPTYLEHIALEAFDWSKHIFQNTGWRDETYLCDEGKAVCGFATKYNELRYLTHDPGVTSVAFACCPYPAAGTLDPKRCEE